MANDPNEGYYQPSKGSISGFTQANIPTGNPDISKVGWSIENLRAFLLNQSDVNFPSNEWVQRVEQMILDHENDFNNPHQTSLSQIVGDFVSQILGSVTPGTIPDSPPFFSYYAMVALPIGGVFPAQYSSTNLYRRTEGGWLSDISSEEENIYTDYTTNYPGIPLFTNMTNIVNSDWDTDVSTSYNTQIEESSDTSLFYPFNFFDVKETPTVSIFGINIPMTQNLNVRYTTSFFIKPIEQDGVLRVYQPSNESDYMEIVLSDGTFSVSTDTIAGSVIPYPDGVLYVSFSFISIVPTPDDVVRIIHLDQGFTGDGSRQGSLGRGLFSIAHPQTTQAGLNQPVMVDISTPSTTSVFTPDLSYVNTPSTLSEFIITMSINISPSIQSSVETDIPIFTFDDLLITRNQSNIKVSVAGTTLFTSTILEGLNKITLSYSPTEILFKDLAELRQTQSGTFPTIDTSTISFGLFDGYLNYFSMYAQSDKNAVIEFLNNG